jgi:hypothetical protein
MPKAVTGAANEQLKTKVPFSTPNSHADIPETYVLFVIQVNSITKIVAIRVSQLYEQSHLE